MEWSRKLILSVMCVVTALVIPAFVEAGAYKAMDALSGEVPSPAPAITSSPASPVTPAPTGEVSLDRETPITLQTAEGVCAMTMHDYLCGVLAGEMPADFSDAALRAQAVCARTYALHEMSKDKPAHPEADVCDSFRCCQVWLDSEALREQWGDGYALSMCRLDAAVSDTDGVILLWEDEPALTCFHASSGGKTEDSASVWGGEIPYLVSVETAETEETVPGFVTEVTVSPEELRQTLCAAHPEAVFTGAPETWITAAEADAAGRIAHLTAGGITVTGTEMRQLFSLRSTAFTLACEGGVFRFTVTGSGHGVGMSQWGAELMAQAGSSWEEILGHYYPGTVIGAAECGFRNAEFGKQEYS